MRGPINGVVGALVAAIAITQLACVDATHNVRAMRAYAHEEASVVVALDRAEDIAKTLELVDRILTGTTYTPGDTWVRRLPLNEFDARKLREEIADSNPYRSGAFEIPTLKVYRRHVERVFDRDGPPPEKAKFPHMMAAVESLSPQGERMKRSWDEYQTCLQKLQESAERAAQIDEEMSSLDAQGRRKRQRDQLQARSTLDEWTSRERETRAEVETNLQLLAITSDVKLDQQERDTVARDAVSAISVAFRLELEALAMIPVVTLQLVRAMASGQGLGSVKPTLKSGEQLVRFPQYVAGVRERLLKQSALLERMTSTLATALHSSVADSPGFQLRESAVDQIVGLTLDSIRVDLTAGAQGFLFTNVRAPQKSSSSDGKTSIDYTGRQFTLDYKVKPIVLASAKLELGLDYVRLPGAINLGVGYQTDRVYHSGGTLETSGLAEQLGVKGAASDVIDVGLGFVGARAGAKIARFDVGTVNQVRAQTGGTAASAPLFLTFTQLDLGYDILFAIDQGALHAFTEELIVGLRALDYTLPRILYQLNDVSPTGDKQDFRYARETPPQAVEARYFMAGATVRFGQGDGPRWSPFLDAGIYGGAGPTSYYFLRDSTLPDVSTNRDRQVKVTAAADGSLAIGLRWRLVPRGSRIRIDLRGEYRGEIIYGFVPSTSGKSRTDFASADIFHGPSLSLHGSL